MKKSAMKKILALGLATAMFAGAGAVGTAALSGTALTANAASTVASAKQFNYEILDYMRKYISITGYNGTDSEVVIPSQIDGMTVDGIGANAFYGNKNVISVTVPSTVTNIGDLAFANCSKLSKVIVPDTVRIISDNAFNGSSNVSICALSNSTAQKFAKRHSIPCKFINLPLESVPFIYTGDKETYIGDTVSVVCRASGGKRETTMDYQYAVYYKRANSTKWTTAQNFSDRDLVEFVPKHIGDYDICVKVKDKTGKVAKKYISTTIYPKFKVKSTLTANEIKLGQKVYVNGIFAGAIEGYPEFEVFYKNENQTKWTRATTYEEGRVVIKPKHTGKYTVCVRGTYTSVNPDVAPVHSKKNLTLAVK